MSDQLCFDLVSIIKPEIICLKLLGFWKSSDKESFFSSRFYKIYRGVVIGSFLVFQFFGFLHAYDKWETITVRDITAILFIYVECCTNLLVMSCIFLNMDVLQGIIQQLRSDMFQPKTAKQTYIAKNLKKSGDFVRKYFSVSSLFIIVFTPLAKLVEGKGQPLYVAYIPSFISYWTCFVFQEIMTIYAVFVCSSYVILDANLLIEIGIQIDILKDSLENSRGVKQIFRSIRHYQKITVLTKDIQHIFRIGISVNFFFGIVVFCTTLFRLMEVVPAELAFMLPYSFGIIVIVFTHCYYGNELIYKSNDLSRAIFHTDWIGSDRSLQKTLIMFMIVTSEPLKVTLGAGTFTMSIPLFISICRTAYSFFTILIKFA